MPVDERTLSNGMKLLMIERHHSPAIAGGWVARVGSVNERPGITGIAHLFEHMMFKGTPTIGTSDAKRDAEIIDQQEVVRDAMRREEAKMRLALRRGEIDDMAKPENKTKRYRELEAEFKELIAAQREVLVKNEFDRIYTTAGASGMNAFTSNDMTGYFITVPANKLELWAWMESERLLRPVFREFYAERDVVFEERRMRTESTPLGKFQESLEAMFWESHPYGWPVIGWPSDIPAISKAQADEFYALHYAPQNITLILVGDFKADEAAKLCERYFERIPRGKRNPPEVVTEEVAQKVEKRMNAEAEANPQVDILWHTPAAGHPDAYALEVLAAVLSGRSGRLHKALVLGDEVATSAFAHQMARKYAGMFNIGGEAKESKTPGDVEAAVEKRAGLRAGVTEGEKQFRRDGSAPCLVELSSTGAIDSVRRRWRLEIDQYRNPEYSRGHGGGHPARGPKISYKGKSHRSDIHAEGRSEDTGRPRAGRVEWRAAGGRAPHRKPDQVGDKPRATAATVADDGGPAWSSGWQAAGPDENHHGESGGANR